MPKHWETLAKRSLSLTPYQQGIKGNDTGTIHWGLRGKGRILFSFCLLSLFTSCAHPPSNPPEARQRPSTAPRPLPYPSFKLKSLQYILRPLPHPPIVGHNLLEIEATDFSFRPLEGLKIKITARHLFRKDLLPYTVIAKPSKEKGIYQARMAFSASGRWRLTLAFIFPSGKSEASTLDLQVVE